MLEFLRRRSLSLTTVILVLLLIAVLQTSISYSITFGPLDTFIPISIRRSTLSEIWLTLRSLLILALFVLWALNRQRTLFKAIIVVNSILTLGLALNLTALLDVLFHFSAKGVDSLLLDVVMMAISNVLIFSIWYWIIDPPGVEESPYEDAPWDFLFPQRGGELPHYESWLPRYTDYLYLAFTTSFAFSPTDVLPLTRRAKMLMLLQSTISIITLTAIAGGAINVLVGGG